MDWQEKAHSIIAKHARIEYDRVNRLSNGKYRKNRRPYTLPAICQELVECLGQNNETKAKAIFVNYDYLIQM